MKLQDIRPSVIGLKAIYRFVRILLSSVNSIVSLLGVSTVVSALSLYIDTVAIILVCDPVIVVKGNLK